MLNIVNVGYDSTNYYVIETSRARLLVDVGFPGTLPKLRHTLKRTGLSLEAVSHLLVTHYHPDHAGLAQELKQLGIRLIVLENQLEAIPALKQILKRDGRYVEITREGNLQIQIAQSRTFLAGLGLAGEIVATPGHPDPGQRGGLHRRPAAGTSG
jgi:glyoxylase-like metal-dependent hydrolase (beta-lactamase superfamily II)